MIRASGFIGASFAALILAGTLPASELPDTGQPVSVIVTAGGQKNEPAPALTIDDVLVSQNRQHRMVTRLEPLRSQNGKQIWILIDEGSSGSLGTQLADLKNFVLAQPATTEIGIGYMRNGIVQAAQPLTTDHVLAAKAIRLPMSLAGISASPYLALTSLVHKWPATSAAREVIMVSSGVDPVFGSGPYNIYLDQAIDTAERSDVVVYTIYYSGAGGWAHSYRALFWGQQYLAQLSADTGGEFYWIGYQNPVSLSPYLDDVSRRLNSQYLLTFLARPENKSGYYPVKITTERPHVKLEGPDKVYVPGSR